MAKTENGNSGTENHEPEFIWDGPNAPGNGAPDSEWLEFDGPEALKKTETTIGGETKKIKEEIRRTMYPARFTAKQLEDALLLQPAIRNLCVAGANASILISASGISPAANQALVDVELSAKRLGVAIQKCAASVYKQIQQWPEHEARTKRNGYNAYKAHIFNTIQRSSKGDTVDQPRMMRLLLSSKRVSAAVDECFKAQHKLIIAFQGQVTEESLTGRTLAALRRARAGWIKACK
jgi:hypothetical protein